MLVFLISLLALNPAHAGRHAMYCETTSTCISRVSQCRLANQDISIDGNQLIGEAKISYTMKQGVFCQGKFISTHNKSRSAMEYISEAVTIDGIRMPDTVEEVPQKYKTKLQQKENCNEYRRDLLETYPQC